MEITEKVLLANGFIKKYGKGGCFYAKGKVGLVKNIKWQPFDTEDNIPLSDTYVNTIEELVKLAQEAGVTI